MHAGVRVGNARPWPEEQHRLLFLSKPLSSRLGLLAKVKCSEHLSCLGARFSPLPLPHSALSPLLPVFPGDSVLILYTSHAHTWSVSKRPGSIFNVLESWPTLPSLRSHFGWLESSVDILGGQEVFGVNTQAWILRAPDLKITYCVKKTELFL